MTIEEITNDIEARGLWWDVGTMAAGFWEARIWEWPNVAVRVRLFKSPTNTCGMEALRQAYDELDKSKYPIRAT